MAARLTAYIVAFIVGLTLIAGLMVGAQRADDGPVDLIIVNGKVFTGEESLAEAVAVQGNKVLRVGSNREIQRLARAQTTVIDAKGGSVLPGFNDAHVHMLSGGLSLDQVSLSEATTLESVKETLKAWAEANPTHDWIRGRGWLYSSFGDGLPTRQMLDQLVPDRPGLPRLLRRPHRLGQQLGARSRRHHARHRHPGQRHHRQGSRRGEPTGVLKEAAMSLMSQAMPVPSRDDKLSALRAAVVEANRVGITSVQNAGGSAEDLGLYDELRKRGELTVRVYQALTVDPSATNEDLDQLDRAREQFQDDPLLKTGAVKLMADGVVETRTAAMLEPYAGPGDDRGELRASPAEFSRLVTELDARGWQVMTHAIGDAAVREVLDAYEAARAANPAPERGRRHRVEHIETPDPDDVPRFGKLGVVASVQPAHGLPPDPGESLGRQSRPRARGARVDVRQPAEGRRAPGLRFATGRWCPSTRCAASSSPSTARPSRASPRAAGCPRNGCRCARPSARSPAAPRGRRSTKLRKGTLERDMLADIVILSADIFSLPPDRLLEAEVVMTIMDGKVVFRRDAPEATDH